MSKIITLFQEGQLAELLDKIESDLNQGMPISCIDDHAENYSRLGHATKEEVTNALHQAFEELYGMTLEQYAEAISIPANENYEH